MLACKHVKARMSDALDGEVRGWYGRYVWLHSRICWPCRRVRQSLERTVSLLHELRDEPHPTATDADRDPSR